MYSKQNVNKRRPKPPIGRVAARPRIATPPLRLTVPTARPLQLLPSLPRHLLPLSLPPSQRGAAQPERRTSRRCHPTVALSHQPPGTSLPPSRSWLVLVSNVVTRRAFLEATQVFGISSLPTGVFKNASRSAKRRHRSRRSRLSR